MTAAAVTPGSLLRRHGPAVALTAAFGAAALAGVVVCPFNAATGLDCPFCGGTRAVLAASRGEFAAAFSHNALVMTAVVALPLLALGVLALMAARVSPHRLRAQLATLPWVVPALTVATVFTVMRNLPFAWAAPLRA